MVKGSKKAKMGSKKTTPSRDHDLADLIGKKIKDITLREIDVGEGNIRQFYILSISTNETLVLACEANQQGTYARATLMDEEDYLEMIQDLEVTSSDDDEEDDDFEDDGMDEDDGFGEEDEFLENEGYDEDSD